MLFGNQSSCDESVCFTLFFCVTSLITLANCAICQQSANSWRVALTHGLLLFRKTLAAIDRELSLLLIIFEEEIQKYVEEAWLLGSLGFLALVFLKGFLLIIFTLLNCIYFIKHYSFKSNNTYLLNK